MDLYVPERGRLLAKVPLFVRVRPQKRARTSRGRFYSPKDVELIDALSMYEPLGLSGPMIVDIHVYFRWQNEKILFPVAPGFGDKDNLEKSILDRMQDRGIIANDRFVVGGQTWKLFAREDYAVIQVFDIKEDVSRDSYIKAS